MIQGKLNGLLYDTGKLGDYMLYQIQYTVLGNDTGKLHGSLYDTDKLHGLLYDTGKLFGLLYDTGRLGDGDYMMYHIHYTAVGFYMIQASLVNGYYMIQASLVTI